MTIRTLKVCLIVLSFVSVAVAQNKTHNRDSIFLGGELFLGMPKDKAITLLTQEYSLSSSLDHIHMTLGCCIQD